MQTELGHDQTNRWYEWYGQRRKNALSTGQRQLSQKKMLFTNDRPINFKFINIILNSVRQHNHFITQGNYKATCFNYKLVMLRPILSIVSQDAMQTLGSHRVYIHGIHQIKSFLSKGVTCKLRLQEWDT